MINKISILLILLVCSILIRLGTTSAQPAQQASSLPADFGSIRYNADGGSLLVAPEVTASEMEGIVQAEKQWLLPPYFYTLIPLNQQIFRLNCLLPTHNRAGINPDINSAFTKGP